MTRVGNAAARAWGLQCDAAVGADQKREEADIDGRHTDVYEQSRHPSTKLHNLAGTDTALSRSHASVGNMPPSARQPAGGSSHGAVKGRVETAARA